MAGHNIWKRIDRPNLVDCWQWHGAAGPFGHGYGKVGWPHGEGASLGLRTTGWPHVAQSGPLTIHLDADVQVAESAQLPASGAVQGCTRSKRRRPMWRPVLPPEWRTELERRGLDVREIVRQAITS